eukprot:SAG31_NODE_4039_length_3643_cov_51.767212_4_plen_84_part_00
MQRLLGRWRWRRCVHRPQDLSQLVLQVVLHFAESVRNQLFHLTAIQSSLVHSLVTVTFAVEYVESVVSGTASLHRRSRPMAVP